MRAPGRSRFEISHATFSVAFAVLLYGVCNALNLGAVARWFRGPAGTDHLALGAYLLAGFCVFVAFFMLLAHRWTIKPAAIALTIVSGAATYFISKYGVAIDSSMIANAIHTDATEVGQLLSWRMLPYAVLLIVVPAVVIIFAEITFAPAGRYLLSSLRVLGIAMVVALVSIYLNFNAIHRAGNVSNKYIVYSLVPVNVLAGSISVASKAVRPWLRSSKPLAIVGSVESPEDLVVVLAIGESSRRANFSLYGYGRRDTNPVLGRMRGLHLLDGIARRGSTLYALPQILEKAGVKLPAMVAALGIPTACYVNYTLYDNCDAPGEIHVADCAHGQKCYDEDVVPLLERDLASYAGGKRFVVLHLGGGSHGPLYRDRHPPEFERLTPACHDADVAGQCTREQLYNSYDNTILYADHVLGQILDRLDRSGAPYVFIYLSDHGESLLEEGRLFHGVPPGVSLPPEQAQIPLIVKASVPISIVARDEYPQQDVFDTVLDLFSIRTPMVDARAGFITRPAAAAKD